MTTMTVTAATLQSIAVTPATPSVADGLTQQFTATGTYSDTTTADITTSVSWSSATSAAATFSNAGGSRGLATAIDPGSSVITATLSGVTGMTTMTVTAATLQSIAVTPATPSKAKGLTQQFTATGTYSDTTTADITTSVTWSSATTASVTISNAGGSKGLATAVNTGSSVITATLSGVTGMTTMTVTAAALQSITVTPSNSSAPKGTSPQMTATGNYSDGSTQDLTTSVNWQTDDVAVATIANTTNSEGLVTTVAQGGCTFTATYMGVTGMTTLTVTAPEVVSVAVTPANTSIDSNNFTTQQMVATATYTDGTTGDVTTDVTWSSSDNSKITISNVTHGLASFQNFGMVTITASITVNLVPITGTTTLEFF
jgi:hypothetical protein